MDTCVLAEPDRAKIVKDIITEPRGEVI